MNTAGLEWFGPPERNTLRPLCVVCLCSQEVENGIVRSESELELCLPSLCLASVGLASSGRALPFICPRGARTQSGAPTGGPGDIFDIVHSGALNATDPEIFVVGLRAYLPTGYGLEPSCWCRQLRT